MDWYGFDINTASTPAPWGAREEQCIKDIIQNIVGDAYGGTSNTAGHRHTKVYDGYGDIVINATPSNATITMSKNVSISGDIDFSGTMNTGTVPWARLSDVPSFYTQTQSDDRYVNVTGDTMTGPLAMGTNSISNTGDAGAGIIINSDNIPSIYNVPVTSGDLRATAILRDTMAYAAGVGGGLSFNGKYDAAGTYLAFAGIKGIKANATDGNYEGWLDLQARANGASPTTEFRIQVGVLRTFNQYLNNTGTASKGLSFDASDNAIFTENIGIGKTTLESWSSTYSALEFGGNSALMGRTSEGTSSATYLLNNVYFDGTWKRISTDETSQIVLSNGDIIFRTDVSGTADAVFTPTQAAKFNSTGKLEMGTNYIGYDNTELGVGNEKTGLSFDSSNNVLLGYGTKIRGLLDIVVVDDDFQVTGNTYFTGTIDKVDVDSDVIRIRTTKSPGAASTGSQGQIAYDSSYLYVCTATNTWKRIALSTIP